MRKYPPSKWYRTGEARIAPWFFGIMRAEVQMRRDHYSPDGLTIGFNVKWVGAGRLPRNLANQSYYAMQAARVETNIHMYFWRTLVSVLPKSLADPTPKSPAEIEAGIREFKRYREEQQRQEDGRILNDED